MSQSLMSSLTASLDAGTINRVAVDTGASEEEVVNGFRATVAAILGGISTKADEPNGMRQVFALVTGGTSASLGSASEFNRAASSTDPRFPLVEQGQRLLSTIFGRNQSSVVQTISHQSGLPSDAVVQMMGMASPMVLSLLGRRVEDQGISFSAFPNLLLREAGDVSSYLPASVHNVLCTANHTLESSPAGVVSAPKDQSRNGVRIFAACLIAAILLGIFWLIRQSYSSHLATVERTQGISNAQARFPGFGRFIERELPGDVRIIIPEDGMESKVISYIQDSSGNTGGEQWFDFDRLTFDTDSAIPKPESKEQLANLAAILQAYPQVRLKVGGYTDNTGDRQANQRLSENRAEAVRRELVGLGIASSRVEAEGYGDQHAIADNATEQGRAKNRRISVKVLQESIQRGLPSPKSQLQRRFGGAAACRQRPPFVHALQRSSSNGCIVGSRMQRLTLRTGEI